MDNVENLSPINVDNSPYLCVCTCNYINVDNVDKLSTKIVDNSKKLELMRIMSNVNVDNVENLSTLTVDNPQKI